MTFTANSDGIPDRHVALVCSCSDMASNVESIVGRRTARMTYVGVSLSLTFLQGGPISLLVLAIHVQTPMLMLADLYCRV